MIHLVDIGNTRVKWARLQNDEYRFGGSQRWRARGLSETISSSWADLPAPQSVLVCNVGGTSAARLIADWVAAHWRCDTRFAEVRRRAAGVHNAYKEPAQMGVDRWIAMIAAWEHCRAPACIVDCGTAITLDVISGTGDHLGGLIAPGIALMQEALASNTAQLPAVEQGSDLTLGRDTASCIAAGCLASASGAIAVVAALVNELGLKEVRWIITGGDAETLMRVSCLDFEHIPDLVLRGLARLAEAGS